MNMSRKGSLSMPFFVRETMTLLFVAVWFATLHAQRMLETIQYNALMQFYSDAGCLPTTCTRFSPGVMCSGDTVFCIGSNVVAITMSGLQLSGTISTHIGVLTALSYLDLSHNLFSGSIPPQLSQLSSLSALALFDNRLTGFIPPLPPNLNLSSCILQVADQNCLMCATATQCACFPNSTCQGGASGSPTTTPRFSLPVSLSAPSTVISTRFSNPTTITTPSPTIATKAGTTAITTRVLNTVRTPNSPPSTTTTIAVTSLKSATSRTSDLVKSQSIATQTTTTTTITTTTTMTASDLSQNGVVRMATVSTQQADASTTGDVDLVMIGAIVGGVLGLSLIGGIIVAIVIARNRRSNRVTNTIEITNTAGLVDSSSQYGVVPKQTEHYDVGDISLKE